MDVSPFRARFGITIVVGVLVGAITAALEFTHTLRISNLAVADASVRGALFGALLTACGVFLTVYLAILAAVTTLDEDRPVIKLMKRGGQYDELIHRLIGPVFSVLALALLAVLCILLPSAPTGADPATYSLGMLALLPCATIGLALGLFAQTASVAHLLAQVLLFKPRQISPSDTVAASVEFMTKPKSLPEEGPPAPKLRELSYGS